MTFHLFVSRSQLHTRFYVARVYAGGEKRLVWGMSDNAVSFVNAAASLNLN